MSSICLPVQLDTFILNEPVCNDGSTLIAPITLPNYVSLRLSNAVIQHDIIPPIDLHNAKPARGNPRVSKVYSAPFTDLNITQPEPKPQDIELNRARFGVYLHWSIPRGYRTGQSIDVKAKDPANPKDVAQPTFKQVPDRWMLIRFLRDHEPVPLGTDLPSVTSWIIESNRLRKLENLPQDLDLETDVTPFVAYSDDNATTDPGLLNSQAELFIGYKTPLKGWEEDKSAKRIPLTTMNSSNPVFADYAIHNCNVFSTHDNFSYKDGNGEQQFLSRATCDYVVVGWHSSLKDPLSQDIPETDPLADTAKTLANRLKDMYLKVPTDEKDPDTKERRRLFCHAAVYNVTYDATVRPETPADTYANNFTSGTDMEPVSVGTTPLDSILSFLEAHSGSQGNTNINDPPPKTVKTLHSIVEQLYATEDTYDEHVKAADLFYYHNYGRTAGGFDWRYDKKKNGEIQDGKDTAPGERPPAQPSKDEALAIRELNGNQRILDAAVSKLRLLQWSLFAEFFKYCSDNLMRRDTYKSRVLALRAEGHALSEQIEILRGLLVKQSEAVEVKRFAQDPFFQRNDPSLCLAGIDSGWPSDYFQDTSTRLSAGLKDPKVAKLADDVKEVLETINNLPVAPDLKETLAKLAKEASGGFLDDTPGHIAWSKQQPFRPQFIEWEGLYYHVPDFQNQWALGTEHTGSSQSNHGQLRYINPKPLHDTSTREDCRHVSGRILVLPQPSFALAAVVKQVLATATPDQLPPELKDPNDAKNDLKLKQDFVAECAKLKFISGQLSGVTDALITIADGQHVKPNLREMGNTIVPMKAAMVLGNDIGLEKNEFTLIDGESGKTPYGTLVDFGANPKFEPFKGVQGGQLVITKLAVVDKFGQVICAPPPARTPYTAPVFPRAIHPCLGKQLIPTVFDDGTINVPFSKEDVPIGHSDQSHPPITPFIQLTPTINQNARLNSQFLQRVETDKREFISWQPSTPWDNPVFGWVVVNYADSTLQFFTAEGIYYTSVQVGGPKGVKRSHNWVPFARPPDSTSKVATQLEQLVATMTDSATVVDGTEETTKGAKYLVSLWTTIEEALAQMPFVPSQYSASANAIVGKPLALVNVGWSLELAQPPLWPQYTPHEGSEDKNHQGGPNAVEIVAVQDPRRSEAAKILQSYRFKVKIGDCERPFDGVVAYWDSENRTPSANSKAPAGGTAFEGFYCYPKANEVNAGTGETKPGYARTFIEPASFPNLSPYFIDPDGQSLAPDDYQRAHTDKFIIKTLLMDPYASIHSYTGILPTKALKLPEWTLSEPIRNMTAFFAMGPILLTKDVPKVFNKARQATPTKWMEQQGTDMTDGSKADLNLAIAGTKGQWQWLQPYAADTASPGSEPAYMSLSVGHEDGSLRLDPGPYTMVEGYLQLASPLLGSSSNAAPS